MMGQKGSKTTRIRLSFDQPTAITKSLSKSKNQKKNSTTSDIVQSNNKSSRQYPFRIIENCIVIWLDSRISESDGDTRNSITHLRGIINFIKTFTDPDHCVNYLAKVKDEQVFFIVSASLWQQVAARISEMSQLTSIYIFCDDKFEHDRCVQEHRKMKGVFTQIETMCHVLKRDVRQSESNITPISIVSSSCITDLNELDPSFMYSQLFKEILLEGKSDKKETEEFINYCRVYYVNNDQKLQVINEFERKYVRPSPIWWYTRECFIYAMLNKAIRKQDVEVIIKMNFFIRDLHRQIEHLHSKVNNRLPFTVYRGQGMLHSEFEKMKTSIGGLLAFNNFLVTSTDRAASLDFAHCARANVDLTAILFRMEVNPSISTTPFASLDSISYFKDADREILFSLHTVFCIGEIKLIEDRLWQVNLTLVSDYDEQLTVLTQYMRETTQATTGLHRMVKLMYHMGDFSKAEQIYTTLLDTTSDDDRQQLALFHHRLGHTFKQKDDLMSALSQYKQSLDIYLTYLPPDDPQLSPIYSKIGQALRKQGDLEGALTHFERALNIDLHAPQPNYMGIATRHSNIGGVLKDQGNYGDALKAYERGLEIYLVHLPPWHPFLAITYSNIGLVHNSMEDHTSALSFYEKTLDIQQRSLPPDHLSLAITHHNMAYALDDLNRTQEAIKHAEQAADITRRSLGSNHFQVQENQRHLDELRQKVPSTDDDIEHESEFVPLRH